MEKVQPRLFFCESAWTGGDAGKRPWQGKIYSSTRFAQENRGVLLDILDYCREHNIPTVFWNKEDPTHYGDRINDFIRTAYLFDYVFTTAEERIERYEYDLKRSDVYALPFAAQPRIFNPLGTENAKDAANFAGTWYAMYPERCAAAEQMMDLVLSTGRDLVIYDRMFDNPSPIYRYPERFQRFVRPSIPYVDTAAAYKKSRFGITLNTVVDSRTMFARRVFELAASGAAVLSNYSVGVEDFFGDSVIFADRDPDRFSSLDTQGFMDLRRRSTHVALNNTYTHRAEQILETVGIPFISRFEKPAVLGYVRTRDDVGLLRSNAAARGIEETIIVVDSDPEPGLQMNLMRERIPCATVVNREELRRADYRTRSLLSRRGVLVAGQGMSLPGTDDIEFLGLHESYSPGPVKRASADETPFTKGRAALNHAYVPAADFRAAFAAEASEVLFV